jgi:gliding motility-associated-like protein
MRNRRHLLLCVLAFIARAASAQSEPARWLTSFQADRCFIENKGQFDGRTGRADEQVLYAVDEGALQILFTARGVVYRFDEKEKNFYRQRGDRSQPRMRTRTHFVRMEWEGSAPGTRLIAEGQRPDAHTYSSLRADMSVSAITGVRGFSRLTYRNLLPGIDVEYTIHPERGIKYAVRVAPGADAARLRMRYQAERGIVLDADGNLRIATPHGDIVDNAPTANLADGRKEPVRARFAIEGDAVRIVLDRYDRRRPVLIDPWVATPPFGNSNRIWDVEVDAASNVYVYGGDTPLRLRKYSPLGALQWTYNTPWDTANYWIGSMVADPAGNCYITAGTDPRIAKVSTNGVLEWSANGGFFDEYWRMSFNCDYTQMVLGGTRLTLGPTLVPIGYGHAFRINLANGAVLSSTNVAALSPSPLISNPNEIRAMTAAPNGRYYFLTLDTIGCITEDLGIIYRRGNSYGFSYRMAGYGVTNQPINAIAATSSFLYTQNGATLHKRAIGTGAILATATIPGGTTTTQLGQASAQNSGIAVDSCGRVVVGSGNAVHLFDADLNLLASAGTPAAVYDVAINHNGEVVACGNGFVASLALAACAPPAVLCCYTSIDAVPVQCANGAPISLSAQTAGGTWSGPGIIDPDSGLFDPAMAGAGTHAITYALPCGSSTIDVVVSPCAPLSVCVDPTSGALVASNGVAPYAWQQQVTTQNCSACLFLCIIPPGCAVNVTNWQTFATAGSIPAPGSYPIRVVDGAGTVLVINSAGELQPCASCPPITVSVGSITSPSCAGLGNGSAIASATGGAQPVAFIWQPGGLPGPSQSALSAGTYTVTATDADGCAGSTTVAITQPPVLTIGVASATDATCAGNDGAATVSVSGGTPGYGISWSNGAAGATATGLAPGGYTAVATDANGCTASVVVAIGTSEGPVILSTTASATTCAPPDGQITIIASGTGLLHSIDGTAYQVSNVFTGLASGSYTVWVMDADSCVATASVAVPSPPAPAPVIVGDAFACFGQAIVLSTAQPYAAYAWSTGATTSSITVTDAGSYAVTVTDAAGCTGLSAPFTTAIGGPVAAFDTDPPSPQQPGTTVQVSDASTASGSAITAWQWSFGAPGSSASGPDASWTYAAAGVYTITLIVTDANGCADTASAVYLIRPEDIRIPNVISPNGDGENDAFVIENIVFFGNELVILNRWGQEVYVTRNYRNTWKADGHPDGTYYYILRLDDEREFTGHLTVLR